MALQELFGNFDELIRTPEDVARLEAAILDLAVRGKLVRQDEKDEPAGELEKRIDQKRTMLATLKLVDREREILPILEDEYPFLLPRGWAFVRLGCLVSKLGAGSTPLGGKAVYTDRGVKFIRSQNVWNDGLHLEDVAYIPPSMNERMSGTIVQPGDVLLNITGASIGRSAVVPDNFDAANVSQHVAILRLLEPDLRNFVHLCLISPLVQRMISSAEVGISREGLSMSRLQHFVLPLPPLPEQHRIVAKVDELLAQTCALAANLRRAQAEIVIVNQATLHHLQTAGDAESLQTAWSNVSAGFDLLYDDPRQLAALRQAILQLAVSGKLVRQESDAETVDDLMASIETRRNTLAPGRSAAKIGRSRKSRDQDDIDFTIPLLPPTWRWTTLDQLSETIHYGYTASADNSSMKYRLLRITDIQNNRVDWSSVPGCIIDEGEAAKYLLRRNDILIARTGGTIGKTFLIADVAVPSVFASYLIRVVPAPELNALYLKLFLESPFYWLQLRRATKGTGQPNVNSVALANLRVPLPPLPEQHRIVAKVDELFALCDALERKLADSAAAQRAAVKSVLAHVLQG